MVTYLKIHKCFFHPISKNQRNLCLDICIKDIRQNAVISLLYGTGIRIGELKNLKFSDIERANNRLLIRQGKGQKDRFVLLPKLALTAIETYSCKFREDSNERARKI